MTQTQPHSSPASAWRRVLASPTAMPASTWTPTPRSRRSRCMPATWCNEKERLLEIAHRIGIAPTLVVAAQQQSLRIS
jgi:hypothetical protein